MLRRSFFGLQAFKSSFLFRTSSSNDNGSSGFDAGASSSQNQHSTQKHNVVIPPTAAPTARVPFEETLGQAMDTVKHSTMPTQSAVDLIMSQLAVNLDKQHQELTSKAKETPAVFADLHDQPEANKAWDRALHSAKVHRSLRFEHCQLKRDPARGGFIFSSEETNRMYVYNAVNDLSPKELSKLIPILPPSLRRIHVVTGVEDQAVDFFADTDYPIDSPFTIEEVLTVTAQTLTSEFKTLGMEPSKFMLLRSPKEDKHSIHWHVQCGNKCFKDYRDVKAFAIGVNDKVTAQLRERLGPKERNTLIIEPPFDTAVYRVCGQMRIAHSTKKNREDSLLSLYHPKSEELRAFTASMRNSTLQEQIELSLSVRSRVVDPDLVVVSCRKLSNEYDRQGMKIPKELEESKKGARFNEILAKMKTYPPEFARNYSTWNNVGCALFSFGPEYHDRAYDAFVSFSRMGGDKFDPNACKKRWYHHYRGGVKGKAVELNWRRGFAYLRSTIFGNFKTTHKKAGYSTALKAVGDKKKKSSKK